MLENERAAIDQIDDQLTDLFVKRLKLAKEIATQKYQADQSISNRGREAQVIADQVHRVDAEYGSYVKDWYQDIMLITKQYEAHIIKDLQDNE